MENKNLQFNKNNRKFQSNVKKDIRIKLPINLFTFRPCREYLILKSKVMGRYEDLALITNELENRGIPIGNIGVLNKIDQLSKSYSHKKVVELVLRWYKRNEQRQN